MSQHTPPTRGNGKICYIEIPAVDIDESAAFYEAVFGWELRKDHEGNTAFDDGVGEVSGTWVTGRNIQPEGGLMIHIMVGDLQATIEKIKIQGGRIVKESAGPVATFCDPAGNVFGLYQSSQS